MTPIQLYQQVCLRADHLLSIQAYVSANATAAVNSDELLRAEWAARVSALDLFVHELVAQRMVQIFDGARPSCDGFNRFLLSTETARRIAEATSKATRSAAFDLAVRAQIERATYQYPDDVAAGVRNFSSVELWPSVALQFGATNATKASQANAIKLQLTQIVRRRNKIVHEGDLQPSSPRTPWPISAGDVASVRQFIDSVVAAIDAVTA